MTTTEVDGIILVRMLQWGEVPTFEGSSRLQSGNLFWISILVVNNGPLEKFL